MDAELLSGWSRRREIPAPVRELLDRIEFSGTGQSPHDLTNLAIILETFEAMYEAVVGDAQLAGSPRSQYEIGDLLYNLKHYDGTLLTITEEWIMAESGPLEKRVAALRFCLAVTRCWGLGYPLTQVTMVERLQALVEAGWEDVDCPIEEEAGFQRAQQCVYSIGLLAIALSSPDVAGDAVRSNLLPKFIRYLRSSLAERSQAQEGFARMDGNHDMGDGVSDLLHGPEKESWEEVSRKLAILKQKCCIQYVAGLGEYLDCLGPLLQAHGVDVVVGLLRCGRQDVRKLTDVLHMVAALLAHRRFAELFIEQGGVQLLLSVPRTLATQAGIAQCLHGLASVPLAFEKVCSFSDAIVEEVVGVALAILKSGTYAGSLKFAVLFFGTAIAYPAIQKAFDAAEGLKPLLGVIRSTVIMLREESTVDLKTEKQVAFYATHAVRQYFRMHFTLQIIQIRRRMCTSQSQRSAFPSRYKAVDLSQEAVEQYLEALEVDTKLVLAFIQSVWAPREQLFELGGAGLLLELVQVAPGERYFHDTAVYALEILYLAALSPLSRAQIFSAKGGLQESSSQDGMMILLNAASGVTTYGDPEVTQSALLVLNKCLTPMFSQIPILPPATNVSRNSSLRLWTSQTPTHTATPRPSSSRGQTETPQNSGNSLGSKLEGGFANARMSLRNHNGIKVLLSLLQARTLIPAAYVYKIRALACQCMMGLARDHTLRLILSRLQIGRVLAELVREPHTVVYQRSGTTGPPGGRLLGLAGCLGSSIDNAHQLFNKVALELIALTTSPGVVGRSGTAAASDAAAPALHKIERAAVAASTRITYPSDDLLKLIYEHLKLTGLHKAAGALASESGLGKQMQQMVSKASNALRSSGSGSGTLRRKSLKISSDVGREVSGSDRTTREDVPQQKASSRRGVKRSLDAVLSPRAQVQEKEFPRKSGKLAVNGKSGLISEREESHEPHRSETNSIGRIHVDVASKGGQDGKTEDTAGPIDLDGNRKVLPRVECNKSEDSGNKGMNPYLLELPGLLFGERKKTIKFGNVSDPGQSLPAHTLACISEFSSGPPAGSRLNGIVMNYLKHQHRQACMQCPTPVSVLPPVSLLRPHSLPEAKRPLDASKNIVRRCAMAQLGFQHGGWGGAQLTRHQIFSKFYCKMSLREDEVLFSCCSYIKSLGTLVVGTNTGDLRVYDNAWDVPEALSAHMSRIFMMDVPRTPSTLLASSSRDEVRIWNVEQMDDGAVHALGGVRSGRFSTSGKQLACISNVIREMKVTLYDVVTGQEVVSLQDAVREGNTSRSFNGVSFGPSDELLVWCNTLWDPRAPKAIHTFDMFTDNHGGCFRPDGLELIMNSEVWDLRTFQLLRSVPMLDGTRVQFNETGEVMYAILQRTLDDYATLGSARRLRHSLHAAFRTLDASDYQEIATVVVERAVMDLALDTTDETVSVVTVDAGDALSSAVRVYTIGRSKHGDEESELEEDSGDDGGDTDGDNGDDDGAELTNGSWGNSSSDNGSSIESLISHDSGDASTLGDGERPGFGVDYEDEEDQDFAEEMAAMLLDHMENEEVAESDYYDDDDDDEDDFEIAV